VVKFDSSDLNISAVEINGAHANFSFGTKSSELGTCINVEIPVSRVFVIGCNKCIIMRNTAFFKIIWL
jgi:hypothetical protein